MAPASSAGKAASEAPWSASFMISGLTNVLGLLGMASWNQEIIIGAVVIFGSGLAVYLSKFQARVRRTTLGDSLTSRKDCCRCGSSPRSTPTLRGRGSQHAVRAVGQD